MKPSIHPFFFFLFLPISIPPHHKRKQTTRRHSVARAVVLLELPLHDPLRLVLERTVDPPPLRPLPQHAVADVGPQGWTAGQGNGVPVDADVEFLEGGFGGAFGVGGVEGCDFRIAAAAAVRLSGDVVCD